MHNSKLIQLLKTCSKEELQAFYKFAQSPYFNTNPKMAMMVDYVRKCGPTFSSKKLKRENVFAHVFPKEGFKEMKMQKYMSEMVGLLETFWVQEYIRKEKEIENELILAKVYRAKDKAHYWAKQVEAVEKKIKKASYLNVENYYQTFQLNLAIHESIEAEGQRDQEPNLQQVFDSMDSFYLIYKLKYYYKAINFQYFKAQDYQCEFIEPILAYIEKGEYDIPELMIYYYGLKCYHDFEEDGPFDELKKLLEKHVHDFPKKESRELFSIAINYCIRQLNKGNRDYLQSVFELYQFEIKEGIIIEDGKIPAATYRNITTTASLLDELDWLEQFLEEYKEAVDEKDYALNVAQLYFRQARYPEIIQLFKAADYDDVLFILSAKAILLKSAYELKNQFVDDYDYEEKLDAELTNFAAFLHRKKRALPKHYIFYLNLTRNLRELFRLTQEADVNQSKLVQLEEQVKALKEIAEKRWLLQKIRELVNP